MAKKLKEADMNLYYINQGQSKKNNIEDRMKRKKAKEREKRIKQNKEQKKDEFDRDTETVIQMTNKNKIKKEEEQRKKITKQERKRKKRNRRIKFVLKTVLFLGIIIGGTVFAMTSPIFDIKNIEVSNNNIISAETIIRLSGLSTENNIFQYKRTEVLTNK